MESQAYGRDEEIRRGVTNDKLVSGFHEIHLAGLLGPFEFLNTLTVYD